MQEVPTEGHCNGAELNFAVRRKCENPKVRAPVMPHVPRQVKVLIACESAPLCT